MPIRELIKEYRGRIWIEAYCHPVGDHDESDSVLDKIESELKELEEKAEAFDWLSKQNVNISEYVLGDGDQNNGGFQGLQIYFYEDDSGYHGKDLLECVRKARGEE